VATPKDVIKANEKNEKNRQLVAARIFRRATITLKEVAWFARAMSGKSYLNKTISIYI